jgi:hypothetical protein
MVHLLMRAPQKRLSNSVFLTICMSLPVPEAIQQPLLTLYAPSMLHYIITNTQHEQSDFCGPHHNHACLHAYEEGIQQMTALLCAANQSRGQTLCGNRKKQPRKDSPC